MHDSPSSLRSYSQQVWAVLKWPVFAIVLVAVSCRGWQLWSKVDTRTVDLHAGWLAGAVLVYVLGWLPAAIYWRSLLAAVGDHISLLKVARAYYCGHLGKYVPGKAGVIVIRAGMIGGSGGRVRSAALTAGYESLTTIVTGAAVALMFSPWIFSTLVERPEWAGLKSLPGYPLIVPIAVIVLYLAMLPLAAKLFARLATVALKKEAENSTNPDTDQKANISTPLLLRGSLLLILGWCVHGLALGCIIRGTGGAAFEIQHWPLWTAAVAAAISGGFLAVFAPGGIGVREWLLAEALQNQIGPQQAVAVAGLFRLISLSGELLASAGLWKFGGGKKTDESSRSHGAHGESSEERMS